MRTLFFSTLNLYLFKRFMINFLIVIIALLTLIYMFDVVELLRRSTKVDDISFTTVFALALLKLPEVGQQLFTFAILFSAIFTFWTMINPLSTILLDRFEILENELLESDKNPINLSDQGLWLRQNYNEGTAIIHAQKIKLPEWRLNNLNVFLLDKDDNFQQRIDAKEARLLKGNWRFKNAVLNAPKMPPQKIDTILLPTEMTIGQLENRFSSVNTISFWDFPRYVETLEKTGFNARPLKIYFQSLLSQPLLFMSMILLAATVSLRPPRNSGAFIIILAGISIGFFVFFSSNFLQALGASAQIPMFVAAWFPAIITFLLGVGTLMTLEDG